MDKKRGELPANSENERKHLPRDPVTSEAEAAQIHAFSRFVAAGQGQISMEEYSAELRGQVDAEFKDFWERRLGPKLGLRRDLER
jgi:hypothetical protein